MFGLFGRSKKQGEKSKVIHDIDPEMDYCPKCRDEYRPGLTSCGVCGGPLMSGQERLNSHRRHQQAKAGRSMVIDPKEDLVQLRTGRVIDMKAMQRLLQKADIPSLLGGDEAGCRKGCCGPELNLLVRKTDLEAANEVLAAEYFQSTGLREEDLSNATAVFNHLAKEAVCPACGCRFSPTVGACPDCGLSFG